jgi:hypothetical protein
LEIQMKRLVIDEILRAAAEIGVQVRELAPEEVTRLRSELSDRFGDGQHVLTFENMRNKSALQDENGWRRLEGFLGAGPHVLFYDSPGFADRAGVEINGTTIPGLIGECFGFPFYVTDMAHTFVVGMNDHDYLIGTGTAASWVASLEGK